MKNVLFTVLTLGLLTCCLSVTASGQNLNLAQYRGKVVYLDFWASWCPPCRESFPWMNAMQRKYGPLGFVIVAVNVDEDHQDAVRFLATSPADFKIVFDPKGKLAEQYNLMGMPSSFLFDRGGHMYLRHMGFRDSSRYEFEEEIRALLDQHPLAEATR